MGGRVQSDVADLPNRVSAVADGDAAGIGHCLQPVGHAVAHGYAEQLAGAARCQRFLRLAGGVASVVVAIRGGAGGVGHVGHPTERIVGRRLSVSRGAGVWACQCNKTFKEF